MLDHVLLDLFIQVMLQKQGHDYHLNKFDFILIVNLFSLPSYWNSTSFSFESDVNSENNWLIFAFKIDKTSVERVKTGIYIFDDIQLFHLVFQYII